MQIQSVKGYDPPKIGSFYEVTVPNSQPFDVAVNDHGEISVAIGQDPYEINLKELLEKIPVLNKKSYWILEKRWACVFYPEWDTPLYFNISAKKVCLLCNGRNTVNDILKSMVESNSKHGQKGVIDDVIRFLFLLKKFKLISFKKNKT
ncbi:MAG: hypothetical protein GX126_14765 [Bacteroidales bacterium]|jgi:hypothetical protein|nr:hypothetical protein [Bacteroidales bacterium]